MAPQAACGPPEYIIWPMGMYMFVRFLNFILSIRFEFTDIKLVFMAPGSITFVSLILIELCGQIVCKFI